MPGVFASRDLQPADLLHRQRDQLAVPFAQRDSLPEKGGHLPQNPGAGGRRALLPEGLLSEAALLPGIQGDGLRAGLLQGLAEGVGLESPEVLGGVDVKGQPVPLRLRAEFLQSLGDVPACPVPGQDAGVGELPVETGQLLTVGFVQRVGQKIGVQDYPSDQVPGVRQPLTVLLQEPPHQPGSAAVELQGILL